MSKRSLQLSVTGLALSAIVQALGMQALGTPLGVGQDMRNIGKGLEPGVGRHGRAALATKPKHVTQVAGINRSRRVRARTGGVAVIRSNDSVSGREGEVLDCR
jgi:hypothetical protein